MGYIILQVSLPNNGYAEIEGPIISFWINGETKKECTLNIFIVEYPLLGKFLLDKGAIRENL